MTTNESIRVDASNAEALEAWDGHQGDLWVENEGFFDAALAGYHDRFWAAAAIAPGHRVLDIGCGNGRTTRYAARLASSGSALGVDLSSRMLALARRRAEEEGLANVEFLQADAQVHPFERGAFDTAISRTGVMFFGDPVAAFRNIATALRPGGRLVLLVWQEWSAQGWVSQFSRAITAGHDAPGPPPGAPGPFSFGDPVRVRQILSDAGFAEVACEGLQESMFFGADVEGAFRFVTGLAWISALLADHAPDPDTRARAETALRENLAAHHGDAGIQYPSAMWLVTAQAATAG